ncbi:MAG: ABC transporter permease DevC [Pseudanabaenaceae cyanobacterium]
MFAIPLAWLQLTHSKGKLLVALAGITFAAILMGMQMGFQDALFRSALLFHNSLDCDLVLVHRSATYILNLKPFSRRRIYQALAVSGVQEVRRMYVQLAPWQAPDLGIKEDILVIGAEPYGTVFRDREINQQQDKIRLPDTVLFDRGSRDDFFGAVVQEFSRAQQTQQKLFKEVSNRKVEVAGMFTMGVSFAANGTLITSDANFLRIFAERRSGEADLGLIKTLPDSDPKQIQQELEAYLDDDIKVLTLQEFIQLEKSYWEESTPIGFIFGFGVVMGFIVGIIIVYQVLYKDINDHLAEYATIKAMGYSNFYLNCVVVQQSISLAGLGYIPAWLICYGLYGLTQASTGLQMELSGQRSGELFCITFLMCLISGLLSIRRVQKADPAEIFN